MAQIGIFGLKCVICWARKTCRTSWCWALNTFSTYYSIYHFRTYSKIKIFHFKVEEVPMKIFLSQVPLKTHVNQVPLKIFKNIIKGIPLKASATENVYIDIFFGTFIILFSVTHGTSIF